MYQSGLYYPFFSLPQVAALQQIANLQSNNDPNGCLSLANNQGAARSNPFLKSPDLNVQPHSSSTISNSGDLDICESIRSDILRQINPDLMSHAIADVPGFIMESGYGFPAQGKMNLYAKAGKRGSNYRQEMNNVQTKRQRLQPMLQGPAEWSGDNSKNNQLLMPPPSWTGNEQITNAIWQYFIKSQQSEMIYNRKVQLRDALYAVVQDVFPYAGLYIVGSSMSGFGTNKSDLDLCLMISHQQIDQKKEATEILMMVQKAFQKCSFIKKAQVIRAKVPILKFWDRVSNVECDLNINNSVGIRNTHLLKYYCSLDWRVRPLALYVKYWARFHDINDARKMTISSYSLSMMLIHYLQYGCSPPVLPCLQKGYVSAKANIKQMRFDQRLNHNSENMQNLDSLGICYHHAFTSQYDQDVMSVRLGTKVPLFMVMEQTDQPSMWKCLCIEEPFDLSNTARSVYDENTFLRVKRVFYSSYTKLSRTRNAETILQHPF
ncbi:hypothetical protein ScPMuIL_018494 [Solemya velum]